MGAVYENRLCALRELLDGECEALLLSREVNIGYFTGFFHSEGCLLVTRSRAVLLVDFRYFEAAQKKAAGCEVVCFKSLSESIGDILSAESVARVCGEANDLTVNRCELLRKKLGERQITLIADGRLDRRIGELRLIKHPSELVHIASAQKIAEQAYCETLNYIKPGVSERAISARLEYEMKLRGAEDVSFSLITVTGKKTSLPHGVPSDDKVAEGDFFTCDFGAVVEGYHSDTTRTVAVGFATDEMREVYSVVLRAQLAALDTVKPGVTCAQADKTARDIISAAGYGEYFGHSTGHGVGLDIHELPFVSSKSDTVLREGMVITDEPGIYLPGKFGVRIEDMLAVTSDGVHNFVNLPKDLIIL